MTHISNTIHAGAAHLPSVAVTNAGLEIEPSSQAFYDLAQTTAEAVNIPRASVLGEVMEPSVLLPTVAVSALALGAVTGALVARWQYRREKTAEKRRLEEARENETTERSLTHAGASLILNRLLANVHIMEHADPGAQDINLVIGGKRRRVDPVTLQTRGDTVIAEGPQKQYTQMTPPHESSYFSSILIKYITSRLGLEFVDKDEVMQVTAVVPRGTNLTIQETQGNVTAQGMFGDVQASIAYGQKLQLDHARNLQVRSGSYSRVHVDSVHGDVRSKGGYASGTSIQHGVIGSLQAVLASYAKLQVGAEVNGADLSAGYGSAANLTSASGTVAVTAASYGQAAIGAGEAVSLTISGGYGSRTQYHGSAEAANIQLASYAQTEIGSAKKLDLNGGYASSTTVESGDIQNARATLSSYAKLGVYGSIHGGDLDIGYGSQVRATQYDASVQVRKSSSGHIITGSQRRKS